VDSEQVWPALGVEVAADRARTWVVRAAEAGERVTVELLEPVPGTFAVLEMFPGWCTGWQVAGIGVDPRSPSATLAEPMAKAGLPVKLADAHAMAVAHGRFRDLLAAGGLRIRGHDALDTAAARASERLLAGSQAVDRYAGADLAPLVAAELAVWVLLVQQPPPFFATWR
jgi:hypothetical protein